MSKDTESTARFKADISGLKEGITEANRLIKLANSEFKAAASGMDDWGRSADGLQAKQRQLTDILEQQQAKMSIYKKEMELVNERHGEGSKEAQNLQIRMNNLAGEIGKTESEMRRNGAALDAMAASEGQAGAQASTTQSRINALKGSVETSNRAIALANSEYKAASDGSKGWASSAEGLTAKQRMLSDVISAQRSQLSDYQQALKLTEQEYGANSKEADELRIKINNLTGEIASTAADAADTEKALRDLAEGERKAGDEAKDAEGKTDSFAKKLSDGLAAAAKVAVGAVTAAAGAVAGFAVGLFKGASDIADYGKEVNIMSQRLNLSREGYQEWEYVLKKSGTSIDVMNMGMKTLQKTMGGLTEDGSASAEAFAAIGISFDEIKGKSPEEALNMTVEAIQKMPPGADRTTASLKLFGRSAMELEPLLNKTAEETDELRQRAHAMGLVLGDEQVDAAGRFRGAMGKIKDQVKGIKMQFSSAFVPAFADGLSAIFNFANGVEGAEDQMNAAVDGIVTTITETLPQFIDKGAEMITAVVSGISSALPKVASALSSVLPQLVGAIASVIPKLVDAVLAAVPQILSALVSAIPVLVQAGIQIILALINGITGMLPELIPVAIEAITTIVSGLLENLPLLLDAALQLILGLAEGLISAIPGLVAMLPPIISAIIDFLASAIPQLIEAGVELLLSLVDNLPAIISGIVDAIPQIISAIVGFLTGPAIPRIIQAGIDLLLGLVKAIPDIIQALVAAIPMIISAIVDFITNPSSLIQIIKAGVELLVGLVKNIPAILKGIFDGLGKIVGGIIDFFTGKKRDVEEGSEDMFSGVEDGMANAGERIAEKNTAMIDGIVGKYSAPETTDAMADAGYDMFAAAGDRADEAAAEMTAATQGIVDDSVVATIHDGGNLAQVASAGGELMGAAAEKSAQAEAAMKGAMQGVSDTAAKTISSSSNLGTAAAQGLAYMTATVQKSAEAKSKMSDSTKTIADGGIAGIKAKQTDMEKAGSDFLSAAAKGTAKAKDAMSDAAKLLATSAIGSLTGYKDSFSSLGFSLSASLAQGIRNGVSLAINAAIQLAQGSIEAARRTLDAHSPSRVFVSMGEDTGEGYEIGMRNLFGRIRKTMSEMMAVPEGLGQNIQASVGAMETHVPGQVQRVGPGRSPTQMVGATNTYNVYIDGRLVDIDARTRRSLEDLLSGVGRTMRAQVMA